MITKKRLMAIFTIILSIIMLSRVFGAEVNTYKPKYATTTANVNLRYQSSLNSVNVLQSVKKGTDVKIIGDQGSFFIVQLNNNKVGFLSKEYVTITSDKNIGKTFTSMTPKEYETKSNVNVRCGPSSSFKKVGSLKKGTIVTVFGVIDNFYVVIFEESKVGLIDRSLLEQSYENVDYNPNNLSKRDLVIYYINEARKENGLKELQDDTDLNRLATLKSEDMVKNNYFLHTSPTLGTPFEMIKNYGLTYNYAGENIAGNTSMKAAVDKWMDSESHKKNILSTNYTKIGVGVTKSDKYGYVIVALFTD